jgi:ATP-binding cassette subfamily B protein
MRSGLAGYAMWMTTVTIFALGSAVAYVLSAYLWDAGAVTIGTVYLIFHYTALLQGPIAEIRAQLTDLQQAEASIDHIEALSNAESRLAEPAAGSETLIPAGPLSVVLNEVSFAYEEESENVLDGVSFSLQPGRVLGLLGRTGSGKTTLARLLLRLYDPNAGQVLLGGVSPRAVRLEELRRRAGLVTQDVQLFQASVRNNLTLFDPETTDEQLLRVLDDLGLGTWLGNLPEGLDTELQAGGGGLSAGQAQLLALARVFLADPGLVILDEASSRLDPATEQLIERAVDRLLDPTRRTGIIIAHRLATVHRADEIIILEDGRILEHGDRVALASDPGSRFYHLLQTGLEEVLA